MLAGLAQPGSWCRSDDGALDPGFVETEAQCPLSLYMRVPFCHMYYRHYDFNAYAVGFGPDA